MRKRQKKIPKEKKKTKNKINKKSTRETEALQSSSNNDNTPKHMNHSDEKINEIEESTEGIESFQPLSNNVNTPQDMNLPDKSDKSVVMNRLIFFVNAFFEKFEKKRLQYERDRSNKTGPSSLHSNGTSTKIGVIIQIIPKGKNIKTAIDHFDHQRRQNKASAIILKLNDECEHYKANLNESVINLGFTIFRNFESQFMSFSDGQFKELKEIATDAVERIMYSLSINMLPTKHEMNRDRYSTFLYRCFLNGKSKGMIGTFFPRRKVSQKHVNLTISNVYEKVGLVTLNEDFTIDKYYKKKGKKSKTHKYGHRLCSADEYESKEDMDAKINESYEKESPPDDPYEYMLRPGDFHQMRNYIITSLKPTSKL